jgi:recombination protein RecT
MTKDMQKTSTNLPALLSQESIRARFNDVLGKKAPAFLSSIMSAYSSNQQLHECEPMSIITAAMIAATLDLPINPSLGMAHIVPYSGIAQFQMGWKGFVQLALRSGQYQTINATPIYEGQIKNQNSFTGDFEFQEAKTSTKVVGYLLYFRLINGYQKYFYMTAEEMEAHAKKYSKAYQKNFGTWKDMFEPMALKTVVKLGLSKYGPLSVDMQNAVVHDQAEIIEGEVTYPDKAVEPQDTRKDAHKRKVEKALETGEVSHDDLMDVESGQPEELI